MSTRKLRKAIREERSKNPDAEPGEIVRAIEERPVSNAFAMKIRKLRKAEQELRKAAHLYVTAVEECADDKKDMYEDKLQKAAMAYTETVHLFA